MVFTKLKPLGIITLYKNKKIVMTKIKKVESQPEKAKEVKSEVKKAKVIKNLGEAYGDNSFQIITEKKSHVKIEDEDKAMKKVEDEIVTLPIETRKHGFSYNQYLVFFSLLAVGLVIGTVLSLVQIRNTVNKIALYEANQDFVASQNVRYDLPSRVMPPSMSTNTQANNTPVNNQNNLINKKPESNTVKATQPNTNVEFNNGNYKVYQKADGSLVIVW